MPMCIDLFVINIQDGKIVCRRKSCPPLSCEHPYLADDACCAVCRDCSYQKAVFRNGERFVAPHDRCQSCVCVVRVNHTNTQPGVGHTYGYQVV